MDAVGSQIWASEETVKRILWLASALVLMTLVGIVVLFQGTSDRLIRNLEAAGINRPQLEQAIQHFRDLGDSQRTEAARYLIENMRDHYYEEVSLFTSDDREVHLDLLRYPDLPSIERDLARLGQEAGPTSWRVKKRVPDLEAISAKLLIDNVDEAFDAWRERPWARKLSHEDFRNCVLPYRIANEPLEDWRHFFLKRYAHLAEELANPSDPIEAASRINDDLSAWFHFDERLYHNFTDMSLSQMRSQRLGRCEDLANMAALAMRANGLAVYVDFTPYWATAHGNHTWNVLRTSDGREIPFMGCERPPGKYNFGDFGFRMAKIYRNRFTAQPDSLTGQVRGEAVCPQWLADRHLEDVTARYFPVVDVDVAVESVPEGAQFLYLSVFNAREWKPIAWAQLKGKEARFKDVGVDFAYLPSFFVQGKVVAAGAPLIPHPDGRVESLTGDAVPLETQSIHLRWIVPTIVHGDGVRQDPVPIPPGVVHTLYVWDAGWRALGRQKAGPDGMSFPGLGPDRLYWLVTDGGGGVERIFTIEKGEPRYW